MNRIRIDDSFSDAAVEAIMRARFARYDERRDDCCHRHRRSCASLLRHYQASCDALRNGVHIMRLTFVQLLLVTSYALTTLRPASVPMWHVYLLLVLACIEALFAAADAKQDRQ